MNDEIRLNIGDEEVLGNRHNLSLFTFIGEQAIFDHVFLQLEDRENDRARGFYIFRGFSVFEPLVQFMDANDYPMHLNANYVPDCDRQAWENYHYADIEGQESYPADWDDAQA